MTGATLVNHPGRALPDLILTTCPREASPPASFRVDLGFVLVFFILVSPYSSPDTEKPNPSDARHLRPGQGLIQASSDVTLKHLD